MEQSLVTKKAVKQLLQIDSSFASAKKEDALGVYRSLPMPKEKDEDWRYTHIGNLKIENFENENSEVNRGSPGNASDKKLSELVSLTLENLSMDDESAVCYCVDA